jgi:hypothetical protein
MPFHGDFAATKRDQSMSNIYDQHQAAFRNVSAYVILKNGERVATIAFKWPRGERLYAYVHWIGVEMTRGHANGGGYDKRSAAVASAVNKMGVNTRVEPLGDEMSAHVDFMRATSRDDGHEWHNRLRNAGFDVVQAV